MTASHRKKVFMMALALILAVLIADRLFVLPKRAGAEDGHYAQEAVVDEVLASLPDLSAAPAPSVSLARRLESVPLNADETHGRGRDAFALSGTWGVTPAPQAVGGPVGEFLKRHRLTAVAVSGRAAHALIDDRAMVPGQQLDGFTLISIHEDRVVFASGQRQFELSLVSDP